METLSQGSSPQFHHFDLWESPPPPVSLRGSASLPGASSRQRESSYLKCAKSSGQQGLRTILSKSN